MKFSLFAIGTLLLSVASAAAVALPKEPDSNSLADRDYLSLPGINIYYSTNVVDGRWVARYRLFGGIRFTIALADAIFSSSTVGSDAATSFYESLKYDLMNMVPEVDADTFRGLYQGLNSSPWFGTIGAQFQLHEDSATNINIAMGIVNNCLNNWLANNGYTLNIRLVSDAFQIGNPTEVSPSSSKRDALLQGRDGTCPLARNLRSMFSDSVSVDIPSYMVQCD